MDNNLNYEKLEKIISKEPSNWLENAQWREDNRRWIRRSQVIALTILRTIRSKEMNINDFAKMMKISNKMVHKYVSGKYDFTLKTISEIELLLGINLININNHDTN